MKEHQVIREALNVFLLAGGSSYMLGNGAVVEHILPLYKEFKSIFIDSCHHKKEEILVERLSSLGYKHSFDLEEEHGMLRDKFKTVMSKYVSGDRGKEMAQAIASYYEALRIHIDVEESKFFKELLILLPKVGIDDEEVKEIFKKVENDLGIGVHERMERLVREMEEILNKDLESVGAVALNVIDIQPYKRHVLIKEIIVNEMKIRGRYKLVLINDHEPVPLYYELLNNEECFDESIYTATKLSETVWISLIPLRAGCPPSKGR